MDGRKSWRLALCRPSGATGPCRDSGASRKRQGWLVRGRVRVERLRVAEGGIVDPLMLCRLPRWYHAGARGTTECSRARSIVKTGDPMKSKVMLLLALGMLAACDTTDSGQPKESEGPIGPGTTEEGAPLTNATLRIEGKPVTVRYLSGMYDASSAKVMIATSQMGGENDTSVFADISSAPAVGTFPITSVLGGVGARPASADNSEGSLGSVTFTSVRSTMVHGGTVQAMVVSGSMSGILPIIGASDAPSFSATFENDTLYYFAPSGG